MMYLYARKLVVMTMVLSTISAIVFGNGSQEGAEGGRTTLEYWAVQESPRVEEYINSAILRFEEEHPDIDVNLTVTPYPQYRNRLTLAVQGGQAPDVFLVDQIWNAEFAAAGSIVPLDDYIAEAGIVASDYFPGAWESAVYEGVTWAIPSDLDVWSFTYFNRDVFAETGFDPEQPPIDSTEGFLEVSRALTDVDAGRYAVALPGGRSEGTVVVVTKFIYSFGGQIVSDDGRRSTLDSPEVIRALEYYRELEAYSPVGVAAAVREDNMHLFKSGVVGMFFFPQFGQDNMDDVPFNWSVAANPIPPGGEHIGTLGGWNMVISEQSAARDAAFEFIEFMTSPEINGGVTSLVPANIEAGTRIIERRTQPGLTLEHLLRARPRPISPIYPQISEVLQDMVQEIFTGTEVGTAVRSASDTVQDLLDEYHG